MRHAYQPSIFSVQGAGEELRPHDQPITREAHDLTREVPRIGAGKDGGVMDLNCGGCGEPWALDYVVHEEPEEFTRTGGHITRCPVCPPVGSTTPLADGMRARAEAAAVIGDLLGDDLDGAAAMMEDAEMLGMFS